MCSYEDLLQELLKMTPEERKQDALAVVDSLGRCETYRINGLQFEDTFTGIRQAEISIS